MESIFYKYMISHGITNIVDIDGLLYAPLNDLMRFCWKAGVASLIAAVLVIVFWYLSGKVFDHFFPKEEN